MDFALDRFSRPLRGLMGIWRGLHPRAEARGYFHFVPFGTISVPDFGIEPICAISLDGRVAESRVVGERFLK